MGRQGRIVSVAGDVVRVDIGGAVALRPGDHLVVFDGRGQLGRIRLDRVSPEWSEGRLLFTPTGPLVGLTASEFIIPTQVIYFANPWLSSVEIGAFGVRHLLGRRNSYRRTGAFWVTQLILGIPFVWLTVTFTVRATSYGLSWLDRVLAPAGFSSLGFGHFLQAHIATCYLVVAGVYLAFLW